MGFFVCPSRLKVAVILKVFFTFTVKRLNRFTWNFKTNVLKGGATYVYGFLLFPSRLKIETVSLLVFAVPGVEPVLLYTEPLV